MVSLADSLQIIIEQVEAAPTRAELPPPGTEFNRDNLLGMNQRPWGNDPRCVSASQNQGRTTGGDTPYLQQQIIRSKP